MNSAGGLVESADYRAIDSLLSGAVQEELLVLPWLREEQVLRGLLIWIWEEQVRMYPDFLQIILTGPFSGW